MAVLCTVFMALSSSTFFSCALEDMEDPEDIESLDNIAEGDNLPEEVGKDIHDSDSDDDSLKSIDPDNQYLCENMCSHQSDCSSSCEAYATGEMTTCGAIGVCNDTDGDGYPYWIDNCDSIANDQTDCDDDGKGDDCDSDNATWQVVSQDMCHAYPDGNFFFWVKYGARYRVTYRDVSDCGAPDKVEINHYHDSSGTTCVNTCSGSPQCCCNLSESVRQGTYGPVCDSYWNNNQC